MRLVVNMRGPGAQSRGVGDVGGEDPHQKKSDFLELHYKGKIQIQSYIKNQESHKKTHGLKNYCHINPHLPCKFGHF